MKLRREVVSGSPLGIAAVFPIAAMLLLAAAPARAATAAGDFALLRDGSRYPGPVRACVGDRCRVGTADLERAAIAWLGLGVALDAVPPLFTGGGDAVVLGDGTVVRARVVGVSAGLVVSAAGEYERPTVRWVRFAPPGEGDGTGAVTTAGGDDSGPPDESGGDGDPGDEDGDEDGDESPSEPVEPPTPPTPPIDPSEPDEDHNQTDPPIPPPSDGPEVDTPRPPNDPPVARCPADMPLGGHIVEDLRWNTRSEDCRGRAEFWFDLVPHFSAKWPGSLYSGHEATEIVYDLKIHGCTPVSAFEACSAPGMSASGTARSTGPLDSLSMSFYALNPALTFEVLPDEIERRLTTPITCRNGTGNWSLQPSNGIRPHAAGDVGVPHVQATLCHGTIDEAQQRDCVLHPARYAVVPFRGEQFSHRPWTSDAFNEETLRWDVCCGCGQPPSGPPPEFSRDPCGDLGIQRGQMQIAVDYSALLRRELRPHLDRFQHEKQQAAQYRNDFEYVSNSCAGWDIAVVLTEALFGGLGAAEGLGPTEGAQAFSKLMSLIQAVIDQDPTFPLTAFLGAAEELEVAGETALEVTLLGIEGFTTSGVIDTVGSITDGALEFLQAGEVQAQRERLEDCTDVPLVAGVTFDGAREYLDHAEAAAREMSAILPLMTRIEQSDTEIYNTWHAYHRACLQYAECSDLDPAVCNPPPP